MTNKLDIINRFPSKRILVIGDIMLDKYVWGSVNRISPEAPVPVLLVEKETYVPGGAANAANNVASFGTTVTLIGVVGNDSAKLCLETELKKQRVNSILIEDKNRPTIVKERIMSRNQQLLRKDYEKTEAYSDKIREKILVEFKKVAANSDAVIISDYSKGINDPKIIKEIIRFCNKKKIISLADFKSANYQMYTDISIIAPNKHDSGKMLGIDPSSDEAINTIGKRFQEELNCQVIITCGSKGMMLFQKNKKPKNIPSSAAEVYDVTGAGDTVSAAVTLALASGATLEDAAKIATLAAAVVIAKAGTSTCSFDELRNRVIKYCK